MPVRAILRQTNGSRSHLLGPLTVMYPDPEIVQIVDENNQEIAAVSRRIMREQRLIHRASYILVFNRADELFVQQRTMTKDIYPGYYDIAAGGVVLAERATKNQPSVNWPRNSASRDIPLVPCFDHYYEDDDNRVWGQGLQLPA